VGERLDSRKSTIGTIVGGIVVVAITMPITMISGTIIARTISFIRAILNAIIMLMYLTMDADKTSIEHDRNERNEHNERTNGNDRTPRIHRSKWLDSSSTDSRCQEGLWY